MLRGAIVRHPLNQKAIRAAWEKVRGSGLFLRCKHINGKTYIQADESVKRHCRYLIIRKAIDRLIPNLPPFDAIFCLEDSLDDCSSDVPIFAFATRSLKENILLMPDPEALSKIDRSYISRVIQKASAQYPWDKKEPKIFWRGTPTGVDQSTLLASRRWTNPRHLLVQMSLENRSWLDAEFSLIYPNSPYKKELQGVLPVSSPVHPKDHLAFRYLIDIDGNSCCYSRTFWTLLSNSLVLKQVTKNRQWFYKDLKPYVHFVPIEENLSDIEEKYLWCLSHEKECEIIRKNGSTFASTHLSYEASLRYFKSLLTAYATWLQDPPTPEDLDERDLVSCELYWAWRLCKRGLKQTFSRRPIA